MQSIAAIGTYIAPSYRLTTGRICLLPAGCEVGHNQCNLYAGTIDCDHAVGSWRCPKATDTVAKSPCGRTADTRAHGSKQVSARLTLRLHTSRPGRVISKRPVPLAGTPPQIEVGLTMNSSSTVSAELGLRLVVPQQTVVPLVASLYYSKEDPSAIRIAFHAGLDEAV